MGIGHNIAHMVRPARTTLVPNETGIIQSVQVQHNEYETRTINSMQLAGFASSLPIGTDIMTVNVGGDNSNGVVVASNHASYRPKHMKTGETMIYDCQTTQQSVLLQADGSIVIKGFHKIIATCDTEMDITCPVVKITGELRVTGAVTAGFGSGDQVTLQNHRHGTGNAASGTVVPTAGT